MLSRFGFLCPDPCRPGFLFNRLNLTGGSGWGWFAICSFLSVRGWVVVSLNSSTCPYRLASKSVKKPCLMLTRVGCFVLVCGVVWYNKDKGRMVTTPKHYLVCGCTVKFSRLDISW